MSDEIEAGGESEQAQTESAALGDADDGLPPNIVTIEDCGQAKKKITIEIVRARIDAKFDEIFGELRNNAQVPGFRARHAPRRLLEKRFGKEAGQDVRNGLISESLAAAVEKNKLNILGEPDIKLDEIELPETGNLTFSVEVEVTPEFALPNYKDISVQAPNSQVTPESIAKGTKRILASRGILAPTTEPAGEDDLVVANCKVTGEGIDQTEENIELHIAPTAVHGIPLENLDEKLMGVRTGQTVTLEATVPQNHEDEAWRGKNVTVTLAVKEVKQLEVPELTDELAKEFGFEDVGKFTEYIKRMMEAQLARDRQQYMRDQVCKFLLKETEVPLPEQLAARHTASMLQRRYVELLYRGVPREQIEKNLEMLEAQAGEQAKVDLKVSFILAKIAEAEGISVEEGEVNARIADMANRQDRRPERLRSEMVSQGTLEQVNVQLVEQKTIDKLLEMANITEAQVAKDEKPKKAMTKSKTKTKTPKKTPE
ncbi:MAG: trigger factor [Planctomycetes bacterium]|nr:trigger factor [Planctomycetota bacterium]